MRSDEGAYPSWDNFARCSRRKSIALTDTTPKFSQYTDRLSQFTAQHRSISRRWSTIANLRLVMAIVLIIALWHWWQTRDAASLMLVVASLVTLATLVVIHTRLRNQRDALQRLIMVNERAISRRALRWDDAPMPPDAGVGHDHPYAWDLNIVGRASMAQRIGTPGTRYGWDAVYRTLLVPGTVEDIPARQESVAELAKEIELHQHVEAAGLREDAELPDPESLVSWAGSPAWLRQRLWLRIISWVSPIVLFFLLGGWAFELIERPLFVVPIIINGIVFALWGQPAAIQEVGS